MSFKSNFSNLLMLSGLPVKFWNEELDFEVHLPKVKDVYFNPELMTFLNFMEKDIQELKKFFDGVVINSKLDFLTIITALGKQKEELKVLSNSFRKSLKLILPESFFNGIYFLNETVQLNDLMFEDILNVVFASLDKKVISITEEDDEFTRIEKEAALRAQKIRENSKNKEEENFDVNNNIEKMLTSVIYEFPQYKLEDVFELNLYTLNHLFKQVGKIANYEVSKIATGNGLSKKHSYFVET